MLVEKGAGEGAGITDAEYQRVGAEIVATADEVWKRAEMIVKVKEPLAPEYGSSARPDHLHVPPPRRREPELTKELVKKKVAAVAYETIQLDDGSLPLLRPMSEVAGKMAVQVGATWLEKEHGGKGVLLGGVPGMRRARRDPRRRRRRHQRGDDRGRHGRAGHGARRARRPAGLPRGRLPRPGQDALLEPETIAKSVREADLVIGAVLVPGAAAPKLVTEALIREMSKGSVVVDVAVDQGGCIETCRPTTHDNPTYEVHGVVHYCVANMPGAVPQTSTFALTNMTRPYAIKIADLGLVEAAKADRALAKGLNTFGGHVTYEAVAKDLGYPYMPIADALGK